MVGDNTKCWPTCPPSLLPPSFLPPSLPTPMLNFFLFLSVFFVVCCLRNTSGDQNLSKASRATRSPGNHITLSLPLHCGIGIGIEEERKDKKLRRFPPSFRNQRDRPSCFPDERESILPYPPLSRALLTSGMTALEGNILGTTEKMCRNPHSFTKWPENGRMQRERERERERERIGGKDGLFMRATLPRERFVCLVLVETAAVASTG